MAHARLSPSNHRWVHCPGSVREEAVYPDTSSEAALDGTGSHLLLEKSIQAWDYANQFLGQVIASDQGVWTVDQARIDRVNSALAYIYGRYQELTTPVYGARIGTESKADPGKLFGRDDWHGTCDVTLRGATTLEVIDYKDGQGFVAVENNPQLLSYAIGKMLDQPDDNVKHIRLTILQPKTTPMVRFVEMSREELVAEAERLNAAAIATDDPDAPLIAGEWCQWCKHRDACPTKNGVSLAALAADETLQTVLQSAPSVDQMTDEQLALVLGHAANLKKLLEQVEAEVLLRLKAGLTVPGWTIGTGPGKRIWNESEEEIEKKLKGMQLLKDEIWVKSFVSPAQAEKRLEEKKASKAKREKLAEMITTVAGKEKPVPAKAEKCAVKMFENVKHDQAGKPSFL